MKNKLENICIWYSSHDCDDALKKQKKCKYGIPEPSCFAYITQKELNKREEERRYRMLEEEKQY